MIKRSNWLVGLGWAAHVSLCLCRVTKAGRSAEPAWLGPQNKRAALAAELALGLLTNYPATVKKAISFHIHGESDLALAPMVATRPEFLAFKMRKEALPCARGDHHGCARTD
jgi:hypothetical protein